MDREISKKKFREQKLKRITGVSVLFLALAAAVIIGPRLLTPTVDDIRHSLDTVTRRTILLTTQASGTLIPAYHELLTTPYTTTISEVLASAGDTINPGDTLILLHTDKIQEDLARSQWELMKKQNNAAKIQEELQQKKVQLSTQLVADSLKRLQLRQKLDKQKKLLAMGGSSKELVEALTTELQLATLQIREKKASFLSFQRIAAINIENLKLEEQLKQQEVRTYQKQLNAAAITPKRRSLLLSLEGSTGQQVVGGTEIAQVAGLEDFDIRGTLNGQQADKIFQGQSAQVRVGSDTLQATVRSISPNIQNGSIGFTLGLIESTDTKLRHNMPVEIFLITNRLESVLVVPNRLLTGAESYQDVFRVKDKELLKQRVLIGGTSYQWAVIEEGLKEGDVIMNDLSQTQKYAKNQRLKWK